MRMKDNEMTIYHVMRSGSLTGTCAVIGINIDRHHKKGREIWLCELVNVDGYCANSENSKSWWKRYIAYLK